GSPQQIAADLNVRKVPSPGATWKRTVRRCEGWARSAIWQMLRNPLYSGTYYWKRVQWVKTETGRVIKPRKQTEWMGSAGNAPELAIIKPALWKLVQLRLNVNKLRPDDKRLRGGGKAIYVLSGLLKCECGANFVMDSATHYRCGRALDGESCEKSNCLRVRRDLAEQIILQPITDRLLSDDMVAQMAREMRAYYNMRREEMRSQRERRPAEVEELDRRIARLRERLKNGDPDLTADELQVIIGKAEVKRSELMAAQPEAKRMDKIFHALPSAAKQYRDQIRKGLQGNPIEAGRARVAVRRLLGDEIILKPAKDRSHLIAHLEFQRAALLAGTVGSVGSGGRI